MIIQCEQCMAKYRLDESRILGETATVKCSRCGHVFQISKERPSPPESPGLSFDQESVQAPFQCPNCGFQQPHSEECIKCGIIFSKYNATPRPRPLHAAGHGPGVDRPLEPSSMTYAGFGVRFAAHIIDGIIAGMIALIILMITVGPTWLAMLPYLSENHMAGNPQLGAFPASLPLALFMGVCLSMVLPVLYFIIMWGRKGATLGKMAMKIKIVSTDGSDISYGTALLRYIGYQMVSPVLLCLGFLWMLWDDRSQTWHDKIASTLVIRTQ